MNKQQIAKVGDWIKDEYRNDRSLGYVISSDDETGMLLVRYPKIAKDTWIVRENRGHYVVI
tara:strand:- start:145 stop:327 length:183 start_codon:yes stop_codon:yes gene_type:complete